MEKKTLADLMRSAKEKNLIKPVSQYGFDKKF